MQSKLFIATIAVMGLSACSTIRDPIPSNLSAVDKLDHRVIDVPAFNRILIDANAMVDISEGPTQEVIIATEPGHFVHLLSSVEDGQLIIDHKKRHQDKYHTFIKITVPDLHGIAIDAVTDANLHDIEAEDFEFLFDGIGAVTMAGSCVNGRFIIDAIGDLEAKRFKCQNLIADFDGIGSIHLYASETLELDASGIGDIVVDGSPMVKKSKIGGIGSTDIR